MCSAIIFCIRYSSIVVHAFGRNYRIPEGFSRSENEKRKKSSSTLPALSQTLVYGDSGAPDNLAWMHFYAAVLSVLRHRGEGGRRGGWISRDRYTSPS